MFVRRLAVAWSLGTVMLCGSCIPCHTSDLISVEGRVVSSATGDPIANAYIGGRAFTDGERTDELPVGFAISGTPLVPPSGENGQFRIEFGTSLAPCASHPVFPRPDRVEIIVAADICVREFSLDINEQTAEFIDAEDGGVPVIELKEPIQFAGGTDGCVSCVGGFSVRGALLDADTLGPLGNADVRIAMLTDEEKTAITVTTDPRNAPSAPDGTFDVTATGFGPCVGGEAELPLPDTLEVKVRPKDCEGRSSRRRFSIGISEETVVHPSAPDDMLELREPILVPPCEE